MDDAQLKAIKLSVELIKADLKKLAKLHPTLAIEHPEVYEAFGLPKEIIKAHQNYVEVEPGGVVTYHWEPPAK